MSWSVSAIGKAGAVSEKISSDLGKIKCMEPEETIKQLVNKSVQVALDAFPKSSAVRVEASGSQSQVDYNDPAKGITNQLSVKIEPIYGFVE